LKDAKHWFMDPFWSDPKWGAVAALKRAKRLRGRTLELWAVTQEDAAFIHEIRSDPVLSRHLSTTSLDVAQQIKWIEAYEKSMSGAYFTIRSGGTAVGTLRIYDEAGEQFRWGSWIMAGDLPATAPIEAMLMVYEYARLCGFREALVDVRQANSTVWRFHEWFGAQLVRQDSQDRFYRVNDQLMQHRLAELRRFLPRGIDVDW